MTEGRYHIFELSSGLKCVHWRTGHHVAYCGVVIGAGSSSDGESMPGLAHFVEHTIFKGTETRKSWQISKYMESLGGDLNAYTSKEETVLYTTAPAEYYTRSLELLADIIGRSVFPASELEKEKDVVIEEIKSYLDSPSDNVYDLFEDSFFAGTPLGHNILGTPESVKMMTGVDCRDFIDRFYVPRNMTLYVASPHESGQVEKKVCQYFDFLHHHYEPRPVVEKPIVERFVTTVDNLGHQAHTVMGARAFSRYDDRRYALLLLNNYFGGPAMSSLLNREMREKRGYVYTVDSNVSLLSATGLMAVYFGSDPGHTFKCRALVEREMKKLAESPMKPRKFESVKRQYVGQLSVSSDNRESCAMSLAKSLLYYGEIHDIDYMAQRIIALSAEEVRSVAEQLASEGFSSFTIR